MSSKRKLEESESKSSNKRSKVIKSNLFKDKHPDLYKQIHPTLNSDIDFDIEKLTYGSHKKLWWICDAPFGHHIWQTTVGKRSSGRGCPFCSKSPSKLCICRSLGTLFPELCKEIDRTLSDIDEFKTFPHCSKKLHWKCSKSKFNCDHHKWEATIGDRTAGYNCPFCVNQKVCECASIMKNYPKLCKEVDLSKTDIDLSTISPGSNVVLPWKCLEAKCDHHKWETSVYQRTHGSLCPFCSKKKFCVCGSTASLYPYLIDELDDTSVDLFTISPGSDIQLSWKCLESECDHHKWKTTVAHRTRGTGCPFCVGNKTCFCKSIAKLHPEIIEEIDDKSNLDLSAICPGSHIKLTWKCKKSTCNHRWVTTIYHRIRRMSGCPKCKQSHMEKQCTAILTEYGEKFTIQEKFDDCKDKDKLPFDFYLPELELLIELDGMHHFEPVCFGGSEKSDLEDRQRKDKIKNDYCVENDYNLLRISYSEAVNMELIITLFIKKIKNSTFAIQEFFGNEYSICDVD